MPNWAPLRVKITLTADGRLDFPDFDQIPQIAASGVKLDRPDQRKWVKYFDRDGSGWKFDKRTNVFTGDAESPIGEHIGCVLLPAAVVDEAVSRFPAQCTRLTPAEFEQWHDRRHLLSDKYDYDVLLGMMVKYFFQHVVDPVNLSPIEKQRLNRRSPELGIRSRDWADVAAERGIVLE